MLPQNFIVIGAYLTEIHEFNRIEFKQIKQIAVHEASIAEEESFYGPGIDDSRVIKSKNFIFQLTSRCKLENKILIFL